MVIFHSYVSLPEGNQQNRDFSWDELWDVYNQKMIQPADFGVSENQMAILVGIMMVNQWI